MKIILNKIDGTQVSFESHYQKISDYANDIINEDAIGIVYMFEIYTEYIFSGDSSFANAFLFNLPGDNTFSMYDDSEISIYEFESYEDAYKKATELASLIIKD